VIQGDYFERDGGN